MVAFKALGQLSGITTFSLVSQTLTLRSVWLFQEKCTEGRSGPLPMPIWIQLDNMLSDQYV